MLDFACNMETSFFAHKLTNIFHYLAHIDPHSAARSTIMGTVQKQRGKWGGWLESTPYEGDGHSNSNNAEEAGDRCVYNSVSCHFPFITRLWKELLLYDLPTMLHNVICV